MFWQFMARIIIIRADPQTETSSQVLVMCEGWSLVSVVWEEGGLSWAWSERGWSLVSLVSKEGGLSWAWSEKSVVCKEGGFSWASTKKRVVSREHGLKGGWSVVSVVSKEGGLSWVSSKRMGGRSPIKEVLQVAVKEGCFLVMVVWKEVWSVVRVVFKKGWSLSHQGGLANCRRRGQDGGLKGVLGLSCVSSCGGEGGGSSLSSEWSCRRGGPETLHYSCCSISG